ncbi:class I SAM-dependent methyltransferase [Candidatus Peregrinibacteria bacterium]|nr:class I SAM-dependent methyltransferase [Candidatus Peregrinibacteria bacterium]
MIALKKYSPTTRFSDRAGIYSAYRPGYPEDVIWHLKDKIGLKPGWAVADIGAGTGLFSRLLLENGNTVYCVEPNAAMRQEGAAFLKGYPKCAWVDGAAEDTTLPAHSMDVVTCAQAFHWFNPEKTKKEFVRIAKKGAPVVLLWSSRKNDQNDFMREHDALLRKFGKNYAPIHNAMSDPKIIEAFYSKTSSQAVFGNSQLLTQEAYLGRIFSASYMPGSNTPVYQEIKAAFSSLFRKYNKNGTVTLYYEIKVYYGLLN